MGDFRIPSLIAVPLWIGSTLAVIGYTIIAFKETLDGNGEPVNSKLVAKQSEKQSEKELQGLVAQLPELKPLNRNRFKKSGE